MEIDDITLMQKIQPCLQQVWAVYLDWLADEADEEGFWELTDLLMTVFEENPIATSWMFHSLWNSPQLHFLIKWYHCHCYLNSWCMSCEYDPGAPNSQGASFSEKFVKIKPSSWEISCSCEGDTNPDSSSNKSCNYKYRHFLLTSLR